MFSSLIFAALAAAWLIVLVPMFARRRQEVSRTTDSTLAARVVRRGSGRHPAAEAPTIDEVEETFSMPDTDEDRPDSEFYDEDQEDEQWRRVYSDDARAGRRYRPGRGGFDPEAAALTARAKYARRQRIVLSMLLAALVTAGLAAFAWPVLWWAHGLVDLVLAGYLTYLRRQVRIEEDIRNRRLSRLSEDREEDVDDEPEVEPIEASDEPDEFADVDFEELPPHHVSAPANAVAVEIDDEDPLFDELDERTWEPYRRASGE